MDLLCSYRKKKTDGHFLLLFAGDIAQQFLKMRTSPTFKMTVALFQGEGRKVPLEDAPYDISPPLKISNASICSEQLETFTIFFAQGKINFIRK